MFSSTCAEKSKKTKTSDVTATNRQPSNLLVPGKVISSTNIPQGAMSMPIVPDKLRGSPDVVQISVGVNCFGTIELEQSCKSFWRENIHWIRAMRISDDCHSYNVQLRLLNSTKQSTYSRSNFQTSLVLQCVRPIEAGQELLLWFSEEIMAMLQIVFLTPANIQGQNKYVCTICSAMYEYPNPLKIHVTLCCGYYSISWLWNKLSKKLLPEEKPPNHQVQQGFDFKLVDTTEETSQKKAMDLSVVSNDSQSSSPEDFKPCVESSAFKPFKKSQSEVKSTSSSPIPNQASQCYFQQWPLLPYPEDYIPVPFDFSARRPDDEAEIETLFSTLGKSKQGHVCLYCGKCYSRKYGLKIHIRTHTGYKPLKCKYCLRPFGDPSNLNKHVRLHSGDNPYKCDLCGKVLVRRRDLERHLKSRHMSDINPESSATVLASTCDSNSNEEMTLSSDEDDPILVD